jgi:hypothetical protein
MKEVYVVVEGNGIKDVSTKPIRDVDAERVDGRNR